MYPFVSLGDWIVLDSWRVMVLLGILAGSLASYVALNREVGRARAWVVVSLMFAAAPFGAHLAHWMLSPNLYQGDLHRIVVFWKDGHSLFGALAFCSLLLLLISRAVPGLPFWPAADAFALGTPLGLVFARIGCYMKGCCWGTPIQAGHPFHGLSVKLARNQLLVVHPVQLYSAAAALGIFCLLLLARRRWKTPGIQALLFILLSTPARFFLEFFRGDTQGRSLFGVFTIYQEICLVLFFFGVCLFAVFVRRTAHYPARSASRSATCFAMAGEAVRPGESIPSK